MSEVIPFDARRAAGPPAIPAPASIENEQAFLGALLLHNEVLFGAGDLLDVEHFTEELHRRIFDVARSLIRSGESASPLTLRPFVGEQDLGNGLTVPTYLAKLCRDALPPLMAGTSARILIDLHDRRRLLQIADEARAVALDAPAGATTAQLVDKIEEDLAALKASAPLAIVTRRSAAEGARKLLDRIARVRAGEEKSRAIAIGLSEIDRDTGGLHPGHLWIIAGRPSMGKTIIATRIARSVARAGYGALLMSFEVGEDQTNARLLADATYSARTPIPFSRILSGDVSDEEAERLEDGQRRFEQMHLIVDCPSGVSVAQIASKVRAERLRLAKLSVKLGVVVIDYLDFITAGDRYRGNRVYEIAEISRGLKQAAKDHDVAIVLLAQINRRAEERADKRPTMADLRDSGNLEQDADVIGLVFREAYYFAKSPEVAAGDPAANDHLDKIKNDLELIIAKNRAGPTRTQKLWCDVACSYVSEQARQAQS